MRRETHRAGKHDLRSEKQAGLWLAIAILMSAVQALGSGGAAASHPSISQDTKAPQHVLLISIPHRRLAVTEDGHVLKIYDIAVGKASTPSPKGAMKIVNKVADPTYYHQGQVVKPGRANPLGDRWMGLSQKGYGIHGTNAQSSVGKAASHGCFRMRRRDVEELFAIVRVGDVVEVRGERDAQLDKVFATRNATHN